MDESGDGSGGGGVDAAGGGAGDGEGLSARYFGGSTVYYVLDALLLARTLYSFLKTYFRKKFERQQLLLPGGAADGAASSTPLPPPRKKVRVYMDGCFDMMHFGHANALRQAKALGDELVVGICPDHEILRNKGPPVMNDEERFISVESVKWVDQIVPGVPYNVTADFLDWLLREHRIDFIIHGDDPCVDAEGRDVYAAVKSAGRFRTIKRTEGVSSTDIVGRMLLCTRDHHLDSSTAADDAPMTRQSSLSGQDVRSLASGADKTRPFTRVSTFLPTTRRLIQFAGEARMPRPGAKVIYVHGSFDMFHPGHILFLRAAKELGDFLLVGIHDDATVNRHEGRNFPIMNLHERTLSVLSSKYVDEVIIGAPWAITADMIKTMNISIVAHNVGGSHPSAQNSENNHHGREGQSGGDDDDKSTENHHSAERQPAEKLGEDGDPYAVPKSLGICREVHARPDGNNISVHAIIDRIVKNRELYIKRNQKKVAQEQQYLSGKEYVQEL